MQAIAGRMRGPGDRLFWMQRVKSPDYYEVSPYGEMQFLLGRTLLPVNTAMLNAIPLWSTSSFLQQHTGNCSDSDGRPDRRRERRSATG